jgi:4-amino-4-deoxy-L-arabinose transferase-like glycosyltransferase
MINYTAWPEMLAWPYLMLQGWLPYKDIAIAHNPLMLLDLVIFFKLFGVGIIQLKIYTWILIATNTFLVYFVSKKFWNKKSAYLSSVLYVLLTIVFEGNGLWFDLVLTPFAILLYYFLRQKNYLWAGVIFALGFLTKQTFVYFALPVVSAMVHDIKNILPKLRQIVIGSGIIFGVFAIVLYSLGILDDYYNWAIKFGILYLPNAVGQIYFPNIKQLIFSFLPFLVLLFTNNLILTVFAIVGMMGVYPRFELFHFQPSLPFIAIAISTVIISKRKMAIKLLIGLFTLLFLGLGVYRQVGTTTRFLESDVEKVVIKINSLQPRVDSLYVINYWDNLYALTNTKPPKPLIPYIPWYLDYGDNKATIINGLKTSIPDVIVIGERDENFSELYQFVDKFYSCNIVDKKVELCQKN